MHHSNCVVRPHSTVQNSRCTVIATHPQNPTDIIAIRRLITCVIYSMIGRSRAEIYNPRWHIYQSTKLQGSYTAEGVYRGYRSTYCIMCNVWYVYGYGCEVYSWYIRPKVTYLPRCEAPKVYLHRYRTSLQCFSSYCCAITIVYFYL